MLTRVYVLDPSWLEGSSHVVGQAVNDDLTAIGFSQSIVKRLKRGIRAELNDNCPFMVFLDITYPAI